MIRVLLKQNGGDCPNKAGQRANIGFRWSEAVKDPMDIQPQTLEQLQAANKKLGHCLQHNQATDGCSRYYASNWDYAKPLCSLEEVRAFLLQIGGMYG